MAGSSWEEEEDEWELCNDDGFVYKRRKRQRVEEPSVDPEPVDPEAVLKRRRKSTRKKLKQKYQEEISQWEILSNTCKAIEEKRLQQQDEQIQQQTQPPSSSGSSMETDFNSESSFVPLLDELLLQVEAHEAVIKDMSSLCDVVETVCKGDAERLEQPLFDLPIWGSPRGLLASLSDEDYCKNIDGNT